VNQALIQMLLETGMIQFGRFKDDRDTVPFRFSFEMLPSYPDVMRMIVSEAKNHLADIQANRFLCAHDSLPFGVALSLEIGIPLVYSLEPMILDIQRCY
jgi:hypothetical protein